MSDRVDDSGDVQSAPLDALSTHLVALGTTDPLAPFPDPDGLDAVLADARIVGLGEATHGTRDIFRLKHRLIRYLVVEHDCRTIALEANFPETLAIDEYVVHGRGDPEAALDGIYFWTWNVESVLALVEWLRAFNDGRPRDDCVRFYGVDAQYTTGAVDRLRTYFEAVDASLPDALSAALEAVDDDGINPDRDEEIDERVAAGERLVATLRDRLDEHREAYVERAGERAWQLANRHVTVIEQATVYRRARVERVRAIEEDAADADDDSEVDPAAVERLLRCRDRAMADNVDWLLDVEDAPVAVWGHDAHLNRSKHEVRDRAVATTPMGGHLADRHGDEYVAIGFSVGGGSFQALGETENEDGERTYKLQEHTLDGPQGPVDAVLDDLGESPALLDIRGASADDRAADWLGTPHGTFSAGATYDLDSPETYITEYTLDEAFDAVCYLDGTTRARPVGTDR